MKQETKQPEKPIPAKKELTYQDMIAEVRSVLEHIGHCLLEADTTVAARHLLDASQALAECSNEIDMELGCDAVLPAKVTSIIRAK